MKASTLGIVMNGVTGRMGANQHLARSTMAIRDRSGVKGTDGSAVEGLCECYIQRAKDTPRPGWNPNEASTLDYFAGWESWEKRAWVSVANSGDE